MSYLIKGKEYSDSESYDKFVNDFVELIEEYKKWTISDDNQIVKSYGHSLAQSDRDPMRDADTVESDLYDIGWDDNNLKKLFTQYRTELMDQLNDESRGGFDVFLYNWTNGDFPLSGNDLGVDDFDELLVRYSYGWNRTKYGQLLLKQNNLLDKFTDHVANAYLNVTFKWFIETLMCPGNLANNYSSKEVMNKTFTKVCKFTKIEGNKITIYYKKITDIINLVMFINDKSESEELYTYYDFISILKKYTNSELSVKENELNINFDNDEEVIVITFN